MLKQVLALADESVAGLRVDIRSRYDDGSLTYPEQHREPIITTLKHVRITRLPEGYRWLEWAWDKHHTLDCGFSGVRLDALEPNEYYIEVLA